MRHDHKHGRRVIWKHSPDSEEIRQHLLGLLEYLPRHISKDFYPIGPNLGEVIMWQLGEFGEQRAIEDLEFVREHSEGRFYEAANEALAKTREMHGERS